MVIPYVDPHDECDPDCPRLIREDCLTSRFTMTLNKSLKQGEQILEGGEKLGFIFHKGGNHLKNEIGDLGEAINTLCEDFQHYANASWKVLKVVQKEQEFATSRDGIFGRLGRLRGQADDQEERLQSIQDQLIDLTHAIQEALNIRVGRGRETNQRPGQQRHHVRFESPSSTSSATSHGRPSGTRDGDTCNPQRKKRH